MKKLILISALFFVFVSTNAQIESGTFLTGGSATFNRYSNNGNSSTTTIINPQLGVAFADDFVGGVWLSFSNFSSVSNWSVAPFLRYYMNNFFIQLGYGYNRSGTTGQSILDAELGYAIFLNDNIALEPALYYNQYFDGNGFGGYDLGAKLGFQLYFNR